MRPSTGPRLSDRGAGRYRENRPSLGPIAHSDLVRRPRLRRRASSRDLRDCWPKRPAYRRSYLQSADLFRLRLQLRETEPDFLKTGLLLGDDLGRGFREERRVVQLALDPRQIFGQTLDLLVQARQFGILVDQALHGNENFHFADQ